MGGIFEEVALGEGGGTTGLGETTTEASGQLETTTEAAAETETTTAVSVEESGDAEADDAKEDESLNEIDTDGFVVSQDTLDSAKKYGYKILLKKVKLLKALKMEWEW